jgi:hypothetical protein
MKDFDKLNLPVFKSDLQALINAHADNADFSKKLLERCMYGDAPAEKNRCKYFFSMLETYAYAQPGNLVPKKLPVILDLSEWHLEHIVPQNPPAGSHSFDEPELHQIGNLCLLPPDWNSKLSNHDYQRKRSIVAQEALNGHNLLVKDSENVFTNPAFANTQWTLTEHAARIQQLTARALQVFVI